MDSMSPEKKAAMMKGMTMSYVGQFIASLVMFYVLAWFIGATGRATLKGGIHIALLEWIGVVVPLAFGNTLWGGKMTMFWLSAGNMLLTLAAAGAIIGAWK